MSLKKIDPVIFTMCNNFYNVYNFYTVTSSHYTEQMFLYYSKKTLFRLGGLAHLRVFIWKIFISPRWDLDKINTKSISI